MSEQTYVRLTFEPVSDEDMNGECKITLLRSTKGKEDQIKTWTCPDVEDGVWMWARIAKSMRDQVLKLAKEFRGEDGIPGATATVIPMNMKDVMGILSSLGIGTGNPLDPFAPVITLKDEKKEDDTKNPQIDEVPDLPK